MRIYHYLRKRGLALFMALVMCLGFLPTPTASAAEADTWDGTRAEEFAGGSGTEKDPYRIETGAQLAYLADFVNGGYATNGKYFRLDADINLNNKAWTPIGTENYSFQGTFMGGEHTISKLKVSNTTAAGLFGYVSEAKVCDFTISSASVTSNTAPGYAGTFAGVAQGSVLCNLCAVNSNVSASNSSTSDYTTAGGIVGAGAATASAPLLICSSSNVALGYTGKNNAAGTVKTFAYNSAAGGIYGGPYGTSTGDVRIERCWSKVNVRGAYGTAGGIAGCDTQSHTSSVGSRLLISDCYNSSAVNVGRVSVTNYPVSAGGIVGRLCNSGSSVTRAYSNINGTNYYEGYVGAPGNGGAPMKVSFAGGIVGYVAQSGITFTQCYNLGRVYTSNTYLTESWQKPNLGYIAGISNGIYKDCYYWNNTNVLPTDSRYVRVTVQATAVSNDAAARQKMEADAGFQNGAWAFEEGKVTLPTLNRCEEHAIVVPDEPSFDDIDQSQYDLVMNHNLYMPAGYSTTMSLYMVDFMNGVYTANLSNNQTVFGDCGVAKIPEGGNTITDRESRSPAFPETYGDDSNLITIESNAEANVGDTGKLAVSYNALMGDAISAQEFNCLAIITVHITEVQSLSIPKGTTKTVTGTLPSASGAGFDTCEDDKGSGVGDRNIISGVIKRTSNPIALELTAKGNVGQSTPVQFHHHVFYRQNRMGISAYVDELEYYLDVYDVKITDGSGGGDDPSTGYAIQVSKKITNKPETIKKGSEIQYQITVTNSGQKTLHDLVIWDVMDPGLTMKLGEDGKPAGATYTDKDGQDVSLAYKGSSKTYYTYGDEGLSEPTTEGNKTAYYWKLPGEFAPGDKVIVTYTDVVSYEGRRAVKLNNHAYAMGYKDAAPVQNGGEDPSVDTQTMAVVMLSAQTYSDPGIPDGTFRPDGEEGAGGVGGGSGGSIGGSGSSGEITVEGEPYKVTFNPNGGGWDGNTNNKVVEVEDPYDPELSEDQQKFAAVGDQMPAEPKREDYKFKGWNTKPDGTGDDFTDSTELTDDITVYAKWEFTGTGAKVTISGEKHWDDNNNATGKRPASITVKLMNGETVVDTKTVSVDKEGKWAYSFEASKYTDEGTQISYTIAEDPVTGYEKVANQEADGKYDLTNRIVSFGYKIEFYKDSTESAENKFGDPVTGTAPYGTVIAGLVTENILTAHKPSDASYGPGAVVTEDQQKTIEATGDNVIRVLYSKGTLRYSFVQHFIDRDGTTEVGFQAVTPVPTEPKAYGTGLAGLIPDGLKGNKTYGEGDAQKTYTFDKDTIKVSVGTAGEKSELKDHPQLTDDDTVIHLYYDVNMIDKDHPDTPGPDDTPDKDQIVFTYVAVADEDGTSHCFTGNAAEVKEVVTKNGAGQASPTNVPAPVVKTGYSFAYWQEEGGSQELTDALLKRMSYGQDTTINAYWTKDEVRTPNLSVSKTVSVNGAAAITATTAKVGDALVYTVTVTNSGNGDATCVTLADNFTGTGTLIWLNGDPTATSFNVPAGRSEVFIAFYRIPSGDAENTIMNSASIKGDPAQPATATVTVDKADEPPAETIDVTWVDGHTGKILDKKAYPKGTEAADIPDGDYPQPEAHQYYVFEGWAKETDAAGNTLITATYRKLEATGGPTYEELRELGIQVTVTCETNATHERHDYELKEGSYDWQVAGNTCFLNIYPDLYVKEFPGTHSIEGIRPATIELTWEPAEQQPAPPEEDPQEEGPQEEGPQEEDPAVTDGPAADEGPDTEDTEIIPEDRLPEGTPETNANADADTETNAGADTEPEDDGEAGMGEEVKQQTQSLESEPAPAGSAGGKWVLANGETSRTVTFLVSCEAAPGPDDPKPEFRKVTVIWMPGTVGGDPIDVVTVDVAKNQPAREALKLVRDPAAPTHEGYEFLRWSEPNVDEANSLITITALWRELSDTQLDVTANAVTATYDGRPHPADVSVKDASGNDIPFTVEYNGSTTVPVNAGTYTAVIKVDGKEVGHTTVTISRRQLTITTGSGSKVYDGRPLTNATATVTVSGGEVSGEHITATATGSQTEVGESKNTYTMDWGSAKEGNYQVTEFPGTLRVTAQSTIIPPTDPYYPPYNPGTPGTTIPDAATPLDPGTDIDDQDVPLAGAVGLNDTDHFAYIAGYENNTVRPTANITRAEVAAIFFRLMTEEFRIANWSTENTFSDVKAGDWFNNAVSTCVKAGIIKGYEDGTFRPGQSITRAEFAAIAARFLGPDADDEGVGDFADTADKWYSADVRKAAKAGWINGMGGSRFEPNANITRAQVMSIVNRMLDRTPDADHMLPTMKTWIDNPEGTWYYVDVQEATNGHDYTRDETNIETWTAIQAEKNWAEIEAEWAANNGASASKDDAQPVEADGETK